MDYSAANIRLWDSVIQFGLIAGALLLSNYLRQTLGIVRRIMMPVAVLAGFILLFAKEIGVVSIDQDLMEMITYHGIALGFIAMSLRVPERSSGDQACAKEKTGLRSGAVIVSSYMIQGAAGLIITLLLSFTIMPGLFRAAGLLLPMGYGQGPGQANNIGASYQAMGFEGGHSFGLAIAAMGYVTACLGGVIILNVLGRKGKLGDLSVRKTEKYEVSYFHSDEEIPISESVDRLSVQLAMIALIYLAVFGVAFCITTGISAVSPGLAETLNTLIWGFNFIIGAAISILVRAVLEKLRSKGVIKRQYQNNYLLNRLSGSFFDVMIAAGISSINIEDIRGLLLPFVLLTVIGAIVTWLHLAFVCRAVYRDYYYEGLISMFGMMTGTISSGVLLLREIDPEMKTPAAGNLITGTSFGILLGAPILVLVGLAPKSTSMCFLTLGLVLLYLLVLDLIIFRAGRAGRRQ